MSELAVEPVVEPIEPIEPVEPVVEPTEPVAPEPVEQAGFDPNNVEHLRAAAEALQGMGYTIGQAPEPVAPQTADPVIPDPFADDYPQQLEAWYEAKRAADLAPVQAIAEYIREQQAAGVDAYIGDQIAKARTDASYTNDLVTDQEIRGLADRYVAETTSKLQPWQVQANRDQIAQDSIKRAIQTFADRDKAIADRSVEAYRASLTEGGGHLLEPGVRTGALQTEAGKTASEREAAAQFIKRRAAAPV